MIRGTLIIILLYLIATDTYAQVQISGTVTDENGDAVIGANVYLEGTYDGSSSDVDGYFSFSTTEKGPQVLIASFIGFLDHKRQIDLKVSSVELSIILKESVTRMGEVVISAGSFEAGGEARREVLQPMDIVTTAGATADLAATLNTLPGTQTVGEQGRVFVRGGDGRETRTFIDGIAVLNEYSPSAPNTPSRSRFLPFMFKGVSFSTGGYSAEYGQALSSALILNSKDEAETPRADISLMSVGADVSYTHTWDKSSATGKIQYTNLSPYFGLVPQTMDWVAAPVSLEGSFAVRSRLGGNSILKVFGNFNTSTFTFNDSPINDPEQKNRIDLENNYRYLNISFRSLLGKEWFLDAGASYSGNRDNVGFNELPISSQNRTMHLKAGLTKDLSDRVTFKFGGESYLPVIDEVYYVDSLMHEDEYRGSITAAYAEADVRLSRKLAFRAGSRIEIMSGTEQLFAVPRLSLAYKLGEFSQLNAAYGMFYQAVQSDYLLQNQNLNQERADHYLLNYQILRDNRTFRVELYHKQYSDLITFNEFPIREQLSQEGYGHARGIDLFWRDAKSISNLDYWISYSFLDTERNYLNFPTTAAPSFASQHNASFVSKYFVNAIRTQVGLTYSFASGRPYTNPNMDGFQNQLTPAYHDLSVNFSFLIKPHIILHGSVSNVLGIDNIFGYEYADQPNGQGVFEGRAIELPAPRFAFMGLFITLSKDNQVNQLPNL